MLPHNLPSQLTLGYFGILELGGNSVIADLPDLEGVAYVAEPKTTSVSCVGSAEGRSSAGGEEEQGEVVEGEQSESDSSSEEEAMKAKRPRNNMFFVERGESCRNRIGQSGDEVSSDSPQFGLLAC